MKITEAVELISDTELFVTRVSSERLGLDERNHIVSIIPSSTFEELKQNCKPLKYDGQGFPVGGLVEFIGRSGIRYLACTGKFGSYILKYADNDSIPNFDKG